MSQQMNQRMGNTEEYEFDDKRVAYAKDSISKQLERANSAISQNNRDIDDLIIKILTNLSTNAGDDMADTQKTMRQIETLDAQRGINRQDATLQTLYDFLKNQLRSRHNLRKTYQSTLLGDEAEIIDTVALLVDQSTLTNATSNPYVSKIQQVRDKILHMVDTVVEKINTLKAKVNSLKMMTSKIAQGAYATDNQVFTSYQDIIGELINLDSSFYGLILMDVDLFYSLLAKSFEYTNRKLFAVVQSNSASYIHAENSTIYFRLLNQGAAEIPYAIDSFLQQYRSYMTQKHHENTDKYLLNNFDAETSEMTSDEAFRQVITLNHRAVTKSIDLAVDNLNVFLEEVNNGRNKNGINYTIFNREYPQIMLRLSPKLSIMEEYK